MIKSRFPSIATWAMNGLDILCDKKKCEYLARNLMTSVYSKLPPTNGEMSRKKERNKMTTQSFWVLSITITGFYGITEMVSTTCKGLGLFLFQYPFVLLNRSPACGLLPARMFH